MLVLRTPLLSFPWRLAESSQASWILPWDHTMALPLFSPAVPIRQVELLKVRFDFPERKEVALLRRD